MLHGECPKYALNSPEREIKPNPLFILVGNNALIRRSNFKKCLRNDTMVIFKKQEAGIPGLMGWAYDYFWAKKHSGQHDTRLTSLGIFPDINPLMHDVCRSNLQICNDSSENGHRSIEQNERSMQKITSHFSAPL